jgi:hypothetical protein
MERQIEATWNRPTLIGGVLFALTQLAALGLFLATLAPKMPASDAPAAEYAAHFIEHGTRITLINYLLTLPIPFLLIFLGGLFGVLRRAEGDDGVLAVTAVGAGIAMAMIWPLGILVSGLGTGIAQEGGDAATIKALDGMAPLSLALSALPRTVLLGATSVVLLRRHLAPRWIGWLGLALAPVSIVASGTLVVETLFPILALGSLLFMFWILALAVALLRPAPSASRALPQVAAA